MFSKKDSSFAVNTILNLPDFDSGQYESCQHLMRDGDALLTLYVTELEPVVIKFKKIRWHQFTSLYLCKPELIKNAYFKLVEIINSPSLADFKNRDPRPPYKELHHYLIFIDETGCHECFAESCELLKG